MYSNIGNKIKILAVVMCILGMIGSFIMSIQFFRFAEYEGTYALAGILVIVIGCLLSWASSFLLYGIGQLIQNSDMLVSMVGKLSGTPVPGSYQIPYQAPYQAPQVPYQAPQVPYQAPQQAAYQAPVSNENAEMIQRLESWRAQGIITEEEYQQQMMQLR